MSNTRVEGRRKLDHAVGNLDTAMNHVKEWLEMGYADREELATQAMLITNAIIETQNGIKKLRDSV